MLACLARCKPQGMIASDQLAAPNEKLYEILGPHGFCRTRMKTRVLSKLVSNCRKQLALSKGALRLGHHVHHIVSVNTFHNFRSFFLSTPSYANACARATKICPLLKNN